jgi:3D (Asp-Asp-Asp) domain-containing protein
VTAPPTPPAAPDPVGERPAAPAPAPLSRRRRRRRRNQRLRIALELVIGAAAIWFVAHPSSFPTLPQPDAEVDSLTSVADSLRIDSGAVGAPITGPGDTSARTVPTGARPNGLSGRVPALAPALVPALVPKGRLFRSIEERARAGERIAVSMTAYCLQGRTRRGNLVRDGIIAVDRKLFPLGREVDLFFGRKKYGRFLADDTGGAIKGGRIDVWMADCAAARRFGRRRGYAQLVRRGE